MSFHLTEPQRLAYLAAMDITSWLPLADRSKVIGPVWQEDTQPEDSQLTNQKTLTNQNTLTEHSAESLDNADASPVVSAPNHIINLKTAILESSQPAKPAVAASFQKAQESPKKVEKPSTIAPINLNISAYIYAHKAGLLVINEAPATGGIQMSESILQLQTAIIAAIAGYDKPWTIKHTGFEWPMVPGPHGDNSLTGAQQAFTYTLDKFMHTLPQPNSGASSSEPKTTPVPMACLCKQLLLLGTRAGELIPALSELKHGYLASSSELMGTRWEGMQVVTSYSLHQLMRVPAKKVQAWQHLQPLVTKLAV